MHTVFINTSRTAIGGRVDVLGIEKEFKKLILLECPLSSWNSKENGFEKCALQIGEMIDTHKEINNRYNLIVYVDLLEFKEYTDIISLQCNPMQRSAIYELLRNMITRFTVSTLYHKLEELGRLPNKKLLLLLEQNHIENSSVGKGVNNIETGDFRSAFENVKMEMMLKLLGLPNVETMKEIVSNSSKDELEQRLTDEFAKQNDSLKTVDPGTLYADKIRILKDSVVQDGVDVMRACMDLYDSMERMYVSDCAHHAIVSEFYTDRRSLNTNKELNTKRNLLVQFFLLDCISSNSLYADGDDAKIAKTVPELSDDQWNRVIDALAVKKATYAREESELASLKGSYSDMKLAPSLCRFASEKFGLDQSGNLRREYVAKKKPADDKGKNKKKKKEVGQESGQELAEVIASRDTDELVEENGRVLNWFSDDEFKLFDAKGQAYTDNTERLLSSEEYIDRATALANHHLKFLSSLNSHISNAMARYAGRSLANEPAVLRKRSVSYGTDITETAKKDYKYTSGGAKETAPLEGVLDSSNRAYTTTLVEYLKFDANRGIIVTTIKEQCVWFINRIRQIEKSLTKLLQMLIVVGVLLIVLYMPFLLIQWEYITTGINSRLIALASWAAPFVLLFIGYGIAVAIQKRKMRKAWKELVKKSDETLAANARAIGAYDKLLTMYIPSLRWVYEYVLDVNYYRDCCKVADAKLAHHRRKLSELCEIVGNILEDLELDKQRIASPRDYDIDYTIAFCEGDNKEFYSIIDKEILEIINE